MKISHKLFMRKKFDCKQKLFVQVLQLMGFFVKQSISDAVPSQSLSTERNYDLLGDIFTFYG